MVLSRTDVQYADNGNSKSSNFCGFHLFVVWSEFIFQMAEMAMVWEVSA